MIIALIIFLSVLNAEISNGLTLFSPLPSQNSSNEYQTYLIDNEENIINTWSHDCKPVTISYLLADSSIIIPCTQNEIPSLGGSGIAGGRILKLSWDGNVLWDDVFVEEYYQPHHDIAPLPNGNILFIAYERKSLEDAQEMGRIQINDEIWPSMIIELQQVGIDSSHIVWKWNLWDHTIQDIDSSLSNYGNISEHPEKININLGTLGGGGGASGDWLHLNSIDYNEELDIIAISSRKMNELYFIDHSTTMLEASSNQGGNFNKGGGFIYRWGNPQNYNRGTSVDQKLFSQHSVNWINSSFPGGGDIILFNNRNQEIGSEVLQITTPVNDFTYTVDDTIAHLPHEYSWRYGDGSFFSNIQSGAYRLKNGNTFISIGNSTTFFEIDSLENIVWEYTFSGPSGQPFNGNIARAQKYSDSYLDSTLIGDLNSDLIINILDVLLIVDIILNQTSFNNESLIVDMNYDGTIDILDIMELISIILQNG